MCEKDSLLLIVVFELYYIHGVFCYLGVLFLGPYVLENHLL